MTAWHGWPSSWGWLLEIESFLFAPVNIGILVLGEDLPIQEQLMPEQRVIGIKGIGPRCVFGLHHVRRGFCVNRVKKLYVADTDIKGHWGLSSVGSFFCPTVLSEHKPSFRQFASQGP